MRIGYGSCHTKGSANVAELLQEFPPVNRGGRPQFYPWDLWLDGQVRRLTKGVDFACEPNSFRTLAYTTAVNRGVVVRSKVLDKSIVIQAVR